MRRTLALVLPAASLLGLGAAQQQSPAPPLEPVITVDGQSFATWQEYTQSHLFKLRGLRCLARPDASATELRPLSDCTMASTTIKPEYEPGAGTLYQIPVVVHIIQSATQGAISDAMVQSQIDVLNEDFRALAGTLGEDGNDAQVEFHLAQVDPNGNPTTGITRTVNNGWFGDSGDYWTSLHWDTNRYLNIYTNQASGALGYVPDLPQGGIVGDDFDRVVILWSAFGRNAPIGPPYDLGRTATHEVGHYFGLFHTFDGGCSSPASCYSNGDRICDTNPESGPVFGCPGASNSCGLGDPFHNYMDYSDDICYSEFTSEQVNRLRGTLENWRVQLHDPLACSLSATSTPRNSGANPFVYTASTPGMGGNFSLTVIDLQHTAAVVLGQAAPATTNLSGGRVLLVNLASPRLFRQPLTLPVGNASLPVPNDAAICGLQVYTQDILFGGGGGSFALSNAVDLRIGL